MVSAKGKTSLVKMIESHPSDIAAKKIEPRSLDKAAHAAQNNNSRLTNKAPHRTKGFFFFLNLDILFLITTSCL